MSALSRRQVFLSGAAVTVAAALPAALGAVHCDAELVIACTEFGRLSEVTNNAWDNAPEDMEGEEAVAALMQPLVDRQKQLFSAVVDTPALTLEGVRARALALVQYEPAILDPYGYGSAGWRDNLCRAVIRDLLAVTGGAV